MTSDKKLVAEYSRPGEEMQGKCTLVSIVPFPIIEEKPGLIPGHFEVEASTDERPRVTIVGECLHYVWIDEVRGSLRVINPSYVIAKSIVNDYVSSHIEVGPDAYPGFFWLPGVLSVEEVERQHEDKLREMKTVQVEWFVRLVRLADDDWQKTRQHFAISDLQRYAAKYLDPENKAGRPWIFVNNSIESQQGPETTLCPACGSDIIKGVVICRFCQYIFDPDRYAEMTFAKRQTGIDISRVLSK